VGVAGRKSVSLIIPPGFGNAAFVFTSTTGTPPIVTTLGVDLSAAGGDFVEAADVAMSAYASWLLPETDTSLTLDHVNLAVGDDGPGGSVDSSLAPQPGTRSGTGSPVSMSTIVRKVTNDIGRRGRGRFYVPALSLAQIDGAGGTVVSAGAIALRDAAATLVANLENLPGTEEYSTLVAVMSAGSATAVRPSEVRVGNLWDVQKRRQDQALETYSSVAL